MTNDISIKNFPNFAAENYISSEALEFHGRPSEGLKKDEVKKAVAEEIRSDVNQLLGALSKMASDEHILPAIKKFIEEHPGGDLDNNEASLGFTMARELTEYLKNDMYRDMGLEDQNAISIIERWVEDDNIEVNGITTRLEMRHEAISLINNLDAKGKIRVLAHTSERTSEGKDFLEHLTEAVKIYSEGGEDALKKFELELGWE